MPVVEARPADPDVLSWTRVISSTLSSASWLKSGEPNELVFIVSFYS